MPGISDTSDSGFDRVVQHATLFYRARMPLLVLFSIPFILAFAIMMLVPLPTYIALGGLYVRSGSIPDMSQLDIAITALAALLSIFVLSDTIVNLNIIIKSKRTRTGISSEILEGIGSYATKIFLITLISILLLFVFQLLTFDNPFQPLLFSLFSLVLSILLFFAPAAIVIDDRSTLHSITSSVKMVLAKPVFVLIWIIAAFALISFVQLIVSAIIPSQFASILVLLINSLFIFPYLIVLQTQMYMEKYPLSI